LIDHFVKGVEMLIKTDLTQKYLELLKKSLLNELYVENEARIVYVVERLLNKSKPTCMDLFNIDDNIFLIDLLKKIKITGDVILLPEQNEDGTANYTNCMRNCTELSHTMIGKKRLDNIQYCMETVINEDIPGDMIETGIWRGGATIFMRGVLAAYGITERFVWAADSFEGVPAPTHQEDAGFDISASVLPVLAVSLEQVMDLFERYGLLDGQVNFVHGWFKDSLVKAPIEKLSVLRLDGDLYESTMDALNPLFGKVSQGGFIIVDDYYSCPPCKRAIDEFRSNNSISDELVQIDVQSVFWRKSSDCSDVDAE
jgi:O-methyltransferase